MTIARYTFLPWLRRGLGNRIEAARRRRREPRDAHGLGHRQSRRRRRRSLPMQTVRLVGPGDVVGVQPAAGHPHRAARAASTDFEPNYLAAIDFYDEDFPWRYSPSRRRRNHRLPPWIALVVLKENEFALARAGAPAALVRPHRQRETSPTFSALGSGMGVGARPLERALGGKLRRRISPRSRRRSTAIPTSAMRASSARASSMRTPAYTAFVVPAFEVGRQAGLGETVADTDDGTFAPGRSRRRNSRSITSGASAPASTATSRRWCARSCRATWIRGSASATWTSRARASASQRSRIRPTISSASRARCSRRPRFRPLAPAVISCRKVAPVLNAPAEARVAGEADPVVAPPILRLLARASRARERDRRAAG